MVVLVVGEERQGADEVAAIREYLDVWSSVRRERKVFPHAHPAVHAVVVRLDNRDAIRYERVRNGLAAHRVAEAALLPHIGRGRRVRDVLGELGAVLVERDGPALDELRHVRGARLVLVDFPVHVQV